MPSSRPTMNIIASDRGGDMRHAARYAENTEPMRTQHVKYHHNTSW